MVGRMPSLECGELVPEFGEAGGDAEPNAQVCEGGFQQEKWETRRKGLLPFLNTSRKQKASTVHGPRVRQRAGTVVFCIPGKAHYNCILYFNTVSSCSRFLEFKFQELGHERTVTCHKLWLLLGSCH